MLPPFLIAAAVAAIAAFSGPAQAQVQFQFGIDRPGYDGPRYHERRGFRGPVFNDDDDCRMVVKRRVNRYGEIVERRMRICD